VRTSKTVGGDTTDYVLDLMATLPVVISDTEAVYLYGLDVIAQQQAERLYYVHDGLGSVRQLVGTTGQIDTNYAYDPFGVPLVEGEVYNPYQYTGEAWDAEVELLYLRARYYQPEVGRFVTKDPWDGNLQQPATLNAFVYATNNPVNLVDPSGLNGPGPLFPELHEEPEQAPSLDVLTYIHAQMVNNAQGPVVRLLWVLNEASGTRQNTPDWPDWIPILGAGQKRVPGIEDAGAKVEALLIFGYMVRQDGPWDPKPYIEIHARPRYSQKVGDYWYYYDIWGNIMFGYLGSAAGFSESELLNGAGLEQIGSDIGYAIQQANPCRLPRPRPIFRFLHLRAWDHPEDRVTAMIGMRLWRRYNVSAQPRHIVEAINEAGNKRWIARQDAPWFGEEVP
jgi:RHS repeat-associated protein